MAAAAVLRVVALTEKPGGTRLTESPWLIQETNSRRVPWKSPSGSVTVSTAFPYSRLPARRTLPPRR